MTGEAEAVPPLAGVVGAADPLRALHRHPHLHPVPRGLETRPLLHLPRRILRLLDLHHARRHLLLPGAPGRICRRRTPPRHGEEVLEESLGNLWGISRGISGEFDENLPYLRTGLIFCMILISVGMFGLSNTCKSKTFAGFLPEM